MFKDILIVGLACWRISSLVVDEEGPWFIFQRIRDFVGVDESMEGVYPANEWYKGIFECVWCCSMWVALVFSVLFYVKRNLAIAVSVPFTISSLAILIHHTIGRLQTEE